MTTEATPRPWTSIGPGEYGDRSVIARYPPQVHIVMTDDHASAAADIALIVTAVNAYDRLRAIEAAALAVMSLIEEDEFFQPEAIALRAALREGTKP